MNAAACCFSGHRSLPANQRQAIMERLDIEMELLMRQGVTDFISGGALGFDQMAALLVAAKREAGANIRLIFALPCPDQDTRWPGEERRKYRALLLRADEVRYVSEEYHSECMKKRNEYMVDHAGYCLCAMLRVRSGTGQTVRYARKKGLRVINVAVSDRDE